jgi:hypothetical protein
MPSVVSAERRQVAATWVVILVDRLPGDGIEVVVDLGSGGGWCDRERVWMHMENLDRLAVEEVEGLA